MPNERERDTVTDTGSAKPTEGRRSVLGKLGILAAGATAALTNPQALFSARPENILAKKAEAAPLADSTEDFKERVRNLLPEKFLGDFRELMRGTAQGCVKQVIGLFRATITQTCLLQETVFGFKQL